MENNNWFKKGDVVKLKDIHSPDMRVYFVDVEALKNKKVTETIHVQWFDKNMVLHRASFDIRDLETVKQVKRYFPEPYERILNRVEKTELNFETKEFPHTALSEWK